LLVNDTRLAHRVVANPEVCGGRPTIEGTRVRVTDILSALAAGDSADDIVEALPYISHDDIKAALSYAALSLDNKVAFAA
jgi:uncharacterized protein (DUF433 family)